MSNEEEVQLEKLKRRKRVSMNGRRWLAFAVLCAAFVPGWRALRIAPLPRPAAPPPPFCSGPDGGEASLKNASAEFEAGEFSQALALVRPLADAGCAPALVLLADMHYAGMGVPKDAALAASLYDKAAAFGYAPALVALGDRYYSGSGVARDEEAAYDAYFRAAELDGGQGLWNAAALLEKGVYPASRAARQSALLQAARAAEASGSISARLLLGQVYESGRLGAKADYPLAYSYYSRAAEAGSGYAAWRAALMCHYGRGISTDYPLAARWYEAAARRGYGQARWNLAFMLFHGGPGVKRAPWQGLRWLFFGPARAPHARVQSGPLAGTERYF